MVTEQDVIKKARELIGYPYLYGGSSPKTGFDCSGFVQYVYKQVGISLPRTTKDQSKIGKKITKKEDLKSGDLIFKINENNEVYHVMLYSGNGNVIEAKSKGTFIIEHAKWTWQGLAVRVLNTENITNNKKVYYRVIAGSYYLKENAIEQQKELKLKGFSSFLAAYKNNDKILYRVVVGSYLERANAEEDVKELEDSGFDSFILIFEN